EKRVFLVILFTSFSGSLVSRIPGAVHSALRSQGIVEAAELLANHLYEAVFTFWKLSIQAGVFWGQTVSLYAEQMEGFYCTVKRSAFRSQRTFSSVISSALCQERTVQPIPEEPRLCMVIQSSK
ncbi:hypothetical protein, partial [Escherichia coli]